MTFTTSSKDSVEILGIGNIRCTTRVKLKLYTFGETMCRQFLHLAKLHQDFPNGCEYIHSIFGTKCLDPTMKRLLMQNLPELLILMQ